MKRMMLAVATCVLLAVAGCGDESKPTPTPVVSAAATASPTQAATPETEQPLPQPGGRLFVYTREVRIEQMGGRGWPTREVVTYNVGLGREGWTFEYGGFNDHPVTAKLAGRQVIVATEARVIAVSLDSRSKRTLYETKATIEDIAVSPDGTLVAVSERAASGSPRDAALRVVEAGTGFERLTLHEDNRFAGFRGRFWQLSWRDDGQAVVVTGATGSEAWGGLATVFIDGTVRVEQVDGYGNVSPTGRMRAGVVGNVQCMVVAAPELVIRDLDSGKETFRISRDGTVFSPWEWAPDGSSFVFSERAWDGDCESLSRDRSFFQVPANGGQPQPVPDLGALHERWYGSDLVTADCDRGNEPVLNRWLDHTVYCYSWDLAATLRLGGKDVGKALRAEVVGFVNP